VTPFASWNVGNPTASLPWYDAYNAVKHDRERNLGRATMRHAIEAAAAVFIMTVAQFGMGHLQEQTPLHPDVFRAEDMPNWPLAECYVRPLQDPAGAGWLGHAAWSPKQCAI
jgi:hypothetical protein